MLLRRRQQSADGELAGRLDRPPVRLGRALPTECRESADGEGDDQDQDEVEQLARVGDREREARLGEQQVIDQERRDGRDDRGHGPAEGADNDHPDEVDGRGIGDLGDLFEDGDDQRADGDHGDGHDGHAERSNGSPERRSGSGHSRASPGWYVRGEWIRAIDNRGREGHTRAMQKFDGSNDGKIDGSPPDPYTEPSWRGTLLMLVIIVGFLVLVAWAFVAIGWSLPFRIRM